MKQVVINRLQRAVVTFWTAEESLYFFRGPLEWMTETLVKFFTWGRDVIA